MQNNAGSLWEFAQILQHALQVEPQRLLVKVAVLSRGQARALKNVKVVAPGGIGHQDGRLVEAAKERGADTKSTSAGQSLNGNNSAF